MKYIYNKFNNFFYPISVLNLMIYLFLVINLISCENQTGAITNAPNTSSRSMKPLSNLYTPWGFSKISVGYLYACGIINNRNAYCWGYNLNGQLGNGTINNSSIPVAIMTGGNSAISESAAIIEISTANNDVCAITNESANNAYCWGFNTYGQLGDGSTNNSSIPVHIVMGGNSAIPNGSMIKQISAGTYNSCAVDNNGGGYCWGANWYGQLGNGTYNDSNTATAVAKGGDRAIPQNGAFIQNSSGSYFHACAITNQTTNNAYCWGFNTYGQLGNGVYDGGGNLPVAVAMGNGSAIPANSVIIKISTGFYHTCAITNESTNNAYCWGFNAYGQLGNGAYDGGSALPVAVAMGSGSAIPANSTIIDISTGFYHTCAVTSTNKAYCWGINQLGQLGDNTFYSSPLPVAVMTGGSSSLSESNVVVKISASSYNTCAIADASAYCWGYNPYGGLGNDTNVSSLLPTQVILWSNLINNTNRYNELNSIALSLAFSDNNLLLGNSNVPGTSGFRNVWQLNNNSIWTNLSSSWSNYHRSAPTALLPLSESQVIVGHFDGAVQYCDMVSCSDLVNKQSDSLGVTSLLHVNNNYFISYSDSNQGSNGKLLVYQENGSNPPFNVVGINSGVGKITTDNNFVYAPTKANGVFKIDLNGINSTDITPPNLQNSEFVTVLYYKNNILYAGTSLANVYKVLLPVNNGNNWIKITNSSLSNQGYISDIALDDLNNLYVGVANLFNPIVDGNIYVLKNNDSDFIQAIGYNDTSSVTSLLFKNNHIYASTFAGNIWQN